MSSSVRAAAVAVDATTYAALQHYYARQMQLLDDGQVDKWAETFTEDGVFATAALPEPVVGRTAIAAGASQVAAQLAADGVARRHWLGMVSANVAGDELVVRSYAMTYQTAGDGTAELRFLNVCLDQLVPHGDSWLVRKRRVTR
jgi:hypothetical protein